MALFRLGRFTFQLNGLAPHAKAHSRSWRWPETERLSGETALQYLGRGPGEITLEATLFPFFMKGHQNGSVGDLEALADRGAPMPLITGTGRAIGYYAITHLDSEESYFTRAGEPRRNAVTLTLARFGDTGSGRGAGGLRQLLRLFG